MNADVNVYMYGTTWLHIDNPHAHSISQRWWSRDGSSVTAGGIKELKTNRMSASCRGNEDISLDRQLKNLLWLNMVIYQLYVDALFSRLIVLSSCFSVGDEWLHVKVRTEKNTHQYKMTDNRQWCTTVFTVYVFFSTCTCPSKNIYEHLDFLLHPMVQSLPTNLKDTIHALSLFEYITQHKPNHRRHRCGVTYIYSSILHDFCFLPTRNKQDSDSQKWLSHISQPLNCFILKLVWWCISTY